MNKWERKMSLLNAFLWLLTTLLVAFNFGFWAVIPAIPSIGFSLFGFGFIYPSKKADVIPFKPKVPK